MVECHWCKTEFEREEATRFEIYMPFYTGPRIHIKNDVCPDCSLLARKAIAAVEVSQRKVEGEQCLE